MTNGKPPAPPRVPRYTYWADPPPVPSARLGWWLERFTAGWRENRRVGGMGYDEAAEFYGVYLWEYINVLYPAIVAAKKQDREAQPSSPNSPTASPSS